MKYIGLFFFVLSSSFAFSMQDQNEQLEELQAKLSCLKNHLASAERLHQLLSEQLSFNILQLDKIIDNQGHELLDFEPLQNQVDLEKTKLLDMAWQSHEKSIKELKFFKASTKKKLSQLENTILTLKQQNIALAKQLEDLKKPNI